MMCVFTELCMGIFTFAFGYWKRSTFHLLRKKILPLRTQVCLNPGMLSQSPLKNPLMWRQYSKTLIWRWLSGVSSGESLNISFISYRTNILTDLDAAKGVSFIYTSKVPLIRLELSKKCTVCLVRRTRLICKSSSNTIEFQCPNYWSSEVISFSPKGNFFLIDLFHD